MINKKIKFLKILFCPEMIVFGMDLCFRADVFSPHRSGLRIYCQLRRSIGVKFCIVVYTRLNFENWLQKFRGPSQKILGAKKHAKFGIISDNFKF